MFGTDVAAVLYSIQMEKTRRLDLPELRPRPRSEVAHTRVTNHTDARFQALHFPAALPSLPFPLRFLHLH
jgi:hypothetical protein